MKAEYQACAAEGEVGYKTQTWFSLRQTIGTHSRAHLFAKELKEIDLPSQNNVPKSGSLHISKNCDGSSSFQGSQRELGSEHSTRSQDTAAVTRERQ